MRIQCVVGLTLAGSLSLAGQTAISSYSMSGTLTVSGVFTNGACTFERAEFAEGPWRAEQNVFTTSAVTRATLNATGALAFYRVAAWDFSGGRTGFTNLTRAYGALTAVAGAGAPQEQINWRPEFEGGPATNALLSSPHITVADRAGNLYIADKDAHGVRQVRPDGTIVTVAGINVPGDGTNERALGTEVALNQPNGLWVGSDGTVFILDLANGKVRRLGTDGFLETLFTVPGGIQAGRGLWVSDDEQLAYVSSLTVVKRWTPDEGVTDFSTGYLQLGNLVIDPWGDLVVTDRTANRVYRVNSQGQPTPIAGNGLTSGGGDGQPALQTALREVRGIWFLPTGAYFVATHRGSQVWYVDTEGTIRLFLNGARGNSPAGNGTWFYNPTEARVSECRAVTMDYEGNVIITENDLGYVRKVRFLPFAP